MPSQLKDRLPNRSLSGPELAAIITWEIDSMLRSDPAYSPNVAYAMAAFTLKAKIALPLPHPVCEIQSRTVPTEGQSFLTGERLRECIVGEFVNMVGR